MIRFRAYFDGKVLVPIDPVDLPTDRVLELVVHVLSEDRPGSPQALLKAMQSLPKVPSEDVDELERAIEAGKLPVSYEGIFDDLRD